MTLPISLYNSIEQTIDEYHRLYHLYDNQENERDRVIGNFRIPRNEKSKDVRAIDWIVIRSRINDER